MLPFRNYIQYWEGWGSIVLWSGELWQPVWDPPHSQLLLLQKLLKDEHHRRIGKGDTSSLSKIILAIYRLYFVEYISLSPECIENWYVSGAHLCDGRPAVHLAQQTPDDQAAADSKHDRLIRLHLVCTCHLVHLVTCHWSPEDHLCSPALVVPLAEMNHSVLWKSGWRRQLCELCDTDYQLQGPDLWRPRWIRIMRARL